MAMVMTMMCHRHDEEGEDELVSDARPQKLRAAVVAQGAVLE